MNYIRNTKQESQRDVLMTNIADSVPPTSGFFP